MIQSGGHFTCVAPIYDSMDLSVNDTVHNFCATRSLQTQHSLLGQSKIRMAYICIDTQRPCFEEMCGSNIFTIFNAVLLADFD